ncbi:MAG: hypothetical protein GY796_00220 [Chloroflexi bacterium]|nr:hypothetical protein [Chloroflexota bacterium]
MTLIDLLPAVQQLPAQDKLKLIRILAEELDSDEDIYPLEPYKVYYLPTPYHIVGAGKKLMDALEESGEGN